jgi:hypothetical protein
MSTEEWQASETSAHTSARQYHYIIPSFLRLLKHLKETGRSFTLVFRTFGQDLPEVRQQSVLPNSSGANET